ncbi:MAG TPA: helicase-related protein, partial [Ignavibacteriaceae bacterium]
YEALEKFKSVKSGTYLCPLRLLALEAFESLTEKKLPVSLITGELVQKTEGAEHVASTIEMVDFEKPVKMAIIDEVQMLADPDRGSAWTHAILGVPADEVWMLGAPEAEAAVVHLASILGEPLEIVRKERLSPFDVEKTHTALNRIPPKSAVVAFSRKKVLEIAAELRTRYKREVSVVYGALSPEVRREQARKFREGETEVVVATDAIGMGLNLPIQSMFFSDFKKWNGSELKDLDPHLTWQIAGRAGRYGISEHGKVSALDPHTLRAIQVQLSKRPDEIPTAYSYHPTLPLVKVLSHHLQTEDLEEIFNFFQKQLKLSSQPEFLPRFSEEQLLLAHEIHGLSLSLQQKLMLTQAPVPLNQKNPTPFFLEFSRSLSRGKPIRLAGYRFLCHRGKDMDLDEAELNVKILTLYSWLHYREPEFFPDFEQVQQEISLLNQNILNMLQKSAEKKCKTCGKILSW